MDGLSPYPQSLLGALTGAGVIVVLPRAVVQVRFWWHCRQFRKRLPAIEQRLELERELALVNAERELRAEGLEGEELAAALERTREWFKATATVNLNLAKRLHGIEVE